jgi:folate-binding protein YgfZ
MNSLWMTELANQGAEFDAGRVTGFGSASTADTILCDLSHYGLIHVTGEDAANFLHGQFCNDVLRLGTGDAEWNGWCSVKGRLLATFLIWRLTDGYILQLPRALQAMIQKRLQMYVLRAKVKLTDVSDDWVRMGIAGPAAKASIHAAFGAVPDAPLGVLQRDNASVVSHAADRFEIVARVDAAMALWKTFASTATKAGAAAWDRAGILDGVIEVLPETQDQFVPQMANFELIGGVSFKKGCYAGQEIVARTQYRGILKRRMVRVEALAGALPKPGDPVFSPAFEGQAAGQIANVAAAPGGGFDALVVAQIEAIKGNALTLENGTALRVLALPYEVTFPA